MPKVSVWFVRASLLHLGIGFTIGALILSHKGLNIAPWSWKLLPSHMDILLLGWMVQLAIGVSAWILPRFTGEHRYGRLTLAWTCFLLLNTGVFIVSISPWADANLLLVGRLLEVVAVGLYAIFIASRAKPFGK